jgi:rhamnulokinase
MDRYIAIDLGAESGRIIVGDLTAIEVVHRFPNRPQLLGKSLYWDMLGLYAEIKQGLREAFRRFPGQIRGIGLDTWGVDYALLDEAGDLLGNPYHYRDQRTEGMMEQVFERVPKRTIFEETGIQFMSINALYQLAAHMRAKPQIVAAAHRLLTVPDLLNYWLTGVAVNEFSILTTTQLYNPRTRDWSWPLIDALGLPRRMFGRIVPPGTVLGPLLPHVAEEVGADPGVPVVAQACHDTACAVAAVPASVADWAYISSGTWSLLGIETREPIINDASFRFNFTNEGSADGGFRFLKDIIGLWIVQECKRSWDRDGPELSYAELTELAEAHGPAGFRIDANDERFLRPGLIADSMPERIRAYCRETGQKPPETPAEMTRGVLESLAELYARTLRELEQVTGRPIRVLHIIGGGSRNTLLCRLSAQATGLPVEVGPAEATAIGSIMLQALALGRLGSIAEGRRLVREHHGVSACPTENTL